MRSKTIRHTIQTTFLLTLCSFWAFSLWAQEDCYSDLSVWYSFTNNTTDESGNGYNGILTGNAEVNNGHLIVPRDLSSSILIPVGAINGATDFTISFHVLFEQFNLEPTLAGWQPINSIVSGWNINNTLILGYKKPLNTVVAAFNGTIYNFELQTELFENQWYCMAYVREGNILRIFLEGEQISQDEIVPDDPVIIAQNGFLLGQDQDCLSGCFEYNHTLSGRLDNFRIYRRALTGAELVNKCAPTQISVQACAGEVVEGYSEAGVYIDNFPDQFGCDSIRILDLEYSNLEILDVVRTHIDCNTYSLSVNASNGIGTVNYSLNNQPFQHQNIFPDLGPGTYIIAVQDESGCMEHVSIIIEPTTPIDLRIDTLIHYYCKQTGSASLTATGGTPPYQYILNGRPPYSNGLFQILEVGEYEVQVIDQNNCEAMVSFTIEEIPSFEVAIQTRPSNCDPGNGSLLADVIPVDQEMIFTLNDTIVQDHGFFGNLAAGEYLLSIEDTVGCIQNIDITITHAPTFTFNSLEIKAADCGMEDGRLSIIAESDFSPDSLSYALNGRWQNSPVFEQLAPGEYQVMIADQYGCQIAISANISQANCPIYVPNAFSPNDDGFNDYFQLYSKPGFLFQVASYLIFDRWGGLVFENKNFEGSDSSTQNWWNGTANGKVLGTGIYVYLIEVVYPNGGKELFVGDVTLLR